MKLVLRSALECRGGRVPTALSPRMVFESLVQLGWAPRLEPWNSPVTARGGTGSADSTVPCTLTAPEVDLTLGSVPGGPRMRAWPLARMPARGLLTVTSHGPVPDLGIRSVLGKLQLRGQGVKEGMLPDAGLSWASDVPSFPLFSAAAPRWRPRAALG